MLNPVKYSLFSLCLFVNLYLQMGVISPSKLRIKLLGTRSGAQKKEGGNSPSRASPSKLEEMEHSKSSLLAEDFEEEGQSM